MLGERGAGLGTAQARRGAGGRGRGGEGSGGAGKNISLGSQGLEMPEDRGGHQILDVTCESNPLQRWRVRRSEQ